MMRYLFLFLAPTILSALGAPQEQQSPRLSKQQVHFELESPVARPVRLSNAILETLKNDPAILQSRCPGRENPSPELLASWLEASQVHLKAGRVLDLVVKASNGCLFGANIGPFWIFRSTDRGYEEVLSTNALALDILPTSSNGYRTVSARAVCCRGSRLSSVQIRRQQISRSTLNALGPSERDLL
jgi:hypothetical protein